MPRELIRAPEHKRRRSLGWLAVAWQTYFVVHGPGDVQGRSLRADDEDGLPLDDELVGVTVDSYAVAQNGRRLYDSAFLSRPKGRDKSGHAGRIVLFESLGPCRFAGWAQGGEVYTDPWGLGFEYRYQPGEPMGRPITYPFIRCLATEEGQAGNTYDNVHYNLTEGPLHQVPGVDPGLTRTFLPDGGEIVPSTASNAAKDGGKETHVVFDETHLYVTPELKRMYATVRRNMAKRKEAEPWSNETSTMYAVGDSSVAEETHALAKAIAEGKTRRSRLYFDHREAPADVDLTDEAQLLEALREVYGPFADVMDLERIISEIWDPRNSPEDSRRYFLNQAQSAVDAWLAEHLVKAVAKPQLVVADKEMIALGFDGSRKRARGVTDATALIASRIVDGHAWPIGIWEQPNGPAGNDWQVPVPAVEAAVDMAFSKYDVVAFYADPAKWETQVADWEARYGQRLKAKATQNHPIQWWITGGRSILTARATEELYNSIVDGQVSFDGSYPFMQHLLNARRRVRGGLLQIAKEHPESPKKIDGAIGWILANKARTDALAAGVLASRRTYYAGSK